MNNILNVCFIQGSSNTLRDSSSTTSGSCEVKDRRALSDAAQIEIGKKLTKRSSQLRGSSSSLTKDKAGKGQLRPQRISLLFFCPRQITLRVDRKIR